MELRKKGKNRRCKEKEKDEKEVEERDEGKKQKWKRRKKHTKIKGFGIVRWKERKEKNYKKVEREAGQGRQ